MTKVKTSDPVYVKLVEYHKVLKQVLTLFNADEVKIVLLKHNFKNIYESLSKNTVIEEKEELLTDFIKEKNALEGVENLDLEEHIYVSQIRDIFYFLTNGNLGLIDKELSKTIEGFSFDTILKQLNEFIDKHK